MPRASDEQLRQFANELSDAMDASGRSRRDLAHDLDITTQAIDNYLAGKREPDLRTVSLLEELLGCPGRLVAALGYTMRSGDLVEHPGPTIEISSSDVDLGALSREDPEAYQALMDLARVQLQRARERRSRP